MNNVVVDDMMANYTGYNQTSYHVLLSDLGVLQECFVKLRIYKIPRGKIYVTYGT